MSVRISISSYAAGETVTPEHAVMMLRKAGFEYAELASEHSRVLFERGPNSWPVFRKFAEDAGLLFLQGHLPLHEDITTADEKKRQLFVTDHKHYCRMYHELGISSAVLHCGGYSDLKNGIDPETVRERRIRSLRELLEDLPEGMTICLENLPAETFSDVEANLKALDYPENLGYCLDTGHLNICREPDPGSYVRRAGKRLKALHLNDNAGPLFTGDVLNADGYASDKHMFPGFFYGSVNWAAVILALNEIGYDSLWNLEVSQDLYPNIPPGVYREVVLRQYYERAQLLFNYDPAAPGPGDPVNDLSGRETLSSGGLTLSFDKWRMAISAKHYQLRIDPVHGARIYSWAAFGREVLCPDSLFGWGISAIWQPHDMAGWLNPAMKLEKITAFSEGIKLVFTRQLGDQNAAWNGILLTIMQTFTETSFTLVTQLTDTSQVPLRTFAPRLHCVPVILNGKTQPQGSIHFADGTAFELAGNERLFRVAASPMIEAPFDGTDRICDIPVPEFKMATPDMAGTLHVSFPDGLVCAVYSCGKDSKIETVEPIFHPVQLQPGQSCQFSMQVLHQPDKRMQTAMHH